MVLDRFKSDDDNDLATSEEVEEVVENLEDNEETENEQVANIDKSTFARFVDNQIQQALTTGRIEADARGGDNTDDLIRILLVMAIMQLASLGVLVQKFYLSSGGG